VANGCSDRSSPALGHDHRVNDAGESPPHHNYFHGHENVREPTRVHGGLCTRTRTKARVRARVIQPRAACMQIDGLREAHHDAVVNARQAVPPGTTGNHREPPGTCGLNLRKSTQLKNTGYPAVWRNSVRGVRGDDALTTSKHGEHGVMPLSSCFIHRAPYAVRGRRPPRHIRFSSRTFPSLLPLSLGLVYI